MDEEGRAGLVPRMRDFEDGERAIGHVPSTITPPVARPQPQAYFLRLCHGLRRDSSPTLRCSRTR